MVEKRGCGGESEGQCLSCDWNLPGSPFSLQMFIFGGLWPGEYPLRGLKASAPVTQNNTLLLENMWFWEKKTTQH